MLTHTPVVNKVLQIRNFAKSKKVVTVVTVVTAMRKALKNKGFVCNHLKCASGCDGYKGGMEVPKMELNVSQSTVQERLDMSAALVRNGYRVVLVVKSDGKKKRTVLVADRMEEKPE